MITLLDKNFTHLNHVIKELNPSKIFIFCDENTHEYCVPLLLSNLNTSISFEIIETEAGEEMKTIETAIQLWEALIEHQADRNALFLNIGGGVITDLGGFVASTYKRGIKFIHIPTTLLAMGDASMGGKTGIDHNYIKNIIGTFAMPEHIFVFPPFLKTLAFIELRSGFAEMLKHGLIADAHHWERLSSIDELTVENISEHIETSMHIKQNVVEQDFKEQNIRKILNFGHTIGHAIESLFLEKGKIIPHGEGVAAGMIVETHLAYLEGVIPEEVSQEIIAKIRKFYPLLPIQEFSMNEILSLMQNDKKNNAGSIRFSLINGIGSCLYDYECQKDHIIQSLEFYKSL